VCVCVCVKQYPDPITRQVLQEGPLSMQHRGQTLRSNAYLRFLQGELYVLEDLHTTQGFAAFQMTSADPAFFKATVERVYLKRPTDASDKGLLAAARCLHRGLPSYRSVLQVQRWPDFRRLQ
jgi:hypothetical protein